MYYRQIRRQDSKLEATSVKRTWRVRCEARFLGCVLLVAMSLPAAAQSGNVADDESARVLSLENAWNQAEISHDAQALGTLLAETFDFTDDDGNLMNKSQWLAYIRNGGLQYAPLGYSGMKVHRYGDVAVATGIYQDKSREKGKWLVHSGRFTDVWTRQNGAWKCVASQATLVTH
jgi:ketosteroid isomerase-like protein